MKISFISLMKAMQRDLAVLSLTKKYNVLTSLALKMFYNMLNGYSKTIKCIYGEIY